MALVEIVRFEDVYEADLAAAFLRSRGIEVEVTERFQTTIDPLMQRALGIRLLGRPDQRDEALSLLTRASAGEFAAEDGDDIDARSGQVQAIGAVLAVAAYATGGFWGNSLPRRFRAPSGIGMGLAFGAVAAVFVIVSLLRELLLNPP